MLYKTAICYFPVGGMKGLVRSTLRPLTFLQKINTILIWLCYNIPLIFKRVYICTAIRNLQDNPITFGLLKQEINKISPVE